MSAFESIPGFEKLVELGRGGMGITYKAFETKLKRLVAIKVINPAVISNQDVKELFKREMKLAAQLHHPNIATIFSSGETPDGSEYFAMEYCEGETLEQCIKKGPFAWPRALEVASQAARGLAAANKKGIIHRDIKPSNLILQEDDEGEIFGHRSFKIVDGFR